MSVIFEIDANRFVPKDYFELKNDNVQELQRNNNKRQIYQERIWREKKQMIN